MYTITITNKDTMPYTPTIIITDILPNNLHYMGFGGTNWTCDARVVCKNTAEIPASDKSVLTISVTSTFTNSQFVTNTVISGTTLSAKDKTDVSADLEVTQTLRPPLSLINKDLIIVITATNNGPNDVKKVTLTDTLPVSLSYKNSNSSGFNSVTGVWNIGEIAAKASKSLIITTTLNKCGFITNTIQGNVYDLIDINQKNNIVSKNVKIKCLELDIKKTDYNTCTIPGQILNYIIPITNVGFITATNLIITDPIDSQLKYLSYSFLAEGNSSIPSKNITFTEINSTGIIKSWNLNNLSLIPNQHITLTLQTKVTDTLKTSTNIITNTVFIKYKDNENQDEHKSAYDTSFTPNLTVVQNNVSPTEGKVNDRLTFSFIISNNNPNVQATNVVFTDTFPSYLTYYSSNSNGLSVSYDYSNRIFTVNLGNIKNKDPKYVYIYMTINNAASSTQTLNNVGTLHFYHGKYYQYRQSNTVQYRILGTSTLPGTGFPPLAASSSRLPLAFWLVLLISIVILFLGLGGIGFGILQRGSAWAGWSRQMGIFITLVGGLFFIFAFLLIQKGHPLDQAVTLASPSPNYLPTATSFRYEPVFQDLATLPDYPIPTPTSIPAEVNGNTPDDTPPNRILIPALGLDTVVKYVPFDGYTWLISGLQNEIAWMGSTSWPGLGGNTGLAGHVTLRNGADGPFRHLEDLQANDVITVFTERNIFTYKVSQKKVVNDDDFSIVQPSQQPILTLITCTGWNRDLGHYLQRLVVVADLVDMKPIAAHSMTTP